MYWVDTDEWQVAPSLNQPRRHHSCCVLGTFVYNICGFDGRNYLNNIERLYAEGAMRGKTSGQWEALHI